MITPSDLSAIAGAVAYSASVITHLGIITINKKKVSNVSILDDLKNVVSKLENADSDVVDKATALSSNPATSGIVSALTDAVKTDLPSAVYDTLADLVSAIKDLAKPAAPVTPAAPAAPAAAPEGPAATVPAAPAAPTSAAPAAEKAPEAPTGQASAAHLMGLPQ